MRAAAYIRLSEDTDTTTSPQRQRADCLQVINSHGWEHNPETDLYEDIDISAYTGVARPAYDRLMASLDRYDVLVVWKLDRVYRRFTGFVRLIETLEAADVRLVSVNDTLDTTTPMGQAIAGFLAAQAETESANMGVRIRSAQQHLTQTGRWRGGKVPYGWAKAEHPAGGWRLVLDPARAPTVLQIVERFEQGWSGRQIADRLNRDRIPSWSGRPWSGQQLYNMVRNPLLAGWQASGGQPVRDLNGDPVPGPEPLIEAERWQRLVVQLQGVEWDRTRRSGSTLLSGIARCGLCGGPMAGWTADHPQASYACSRKADSGASVCRGVAIKRDWLDTYVGQQVIEAVRLWRYKIPDPPASIDPDPVGPLVAQLRRLERDRTELGLYDDPESEQVYAARWRELRRQIGEARRAAEDRAGRDVRPSPDVVVPDDLEARWWNPDGLSTDVKRQVVRSLVDRVEVRPTKKWRQLDPGRLRVVWLSEV